MKKELVICVIVVALVVIGNIITQNYTKKCVATMDTELNELKEIIISSEDNKDSKENKEKVYKKTKDVKNAWDEMQEKLAFYIEHDELEKVETQISMLEGQVEGAEYTDTFAEIEKCIFILEHIEDKTSLTVKNVF